MLVFVHGEFPVCLEKDALWPVLLPRSHPGATQIWTNRLEHPLRIQRNRFEDIGPAAGHVPQPILGQSVARVSLCHRWIRKIVLLNSSVDKTPVNGRCKMAAFISVKYP